MAKLIDPDDLNQGTEVVITTGTKQIQLLVAGNLVDTPTGAESGVTGKAFYSFLKEEWESDTALNKFRFPLQMIYEAQFIWVNGWVPADDQTRDLIRDAGFKETDGRENACIISLGAFNDSTVSAYYANVAGLDQTTLTFDKPGELNENIQIKGTGGTPDNSDYFKAFLRADQDVYSEYNLLTEQGLSALTYQAYRLPLSSSVDNDAVDDYTQVGTTDVGTISGVTYSELSVDYIQGTGYTTATARSYVQDEIVLDTATPPRWYRCTTAGTADATDILDLGTMGGAGTAVFAVFEGEREIGTDNFYAFNRIVDANDVGLTAARITEIHSWAQYQLSLSSDINADTTLTTFGTVNGDVARLLTGVVAGKMNTEPGVYIDNFDVNDKNDINFFDITVDGGVDSEYVPVVSTQRNFPFVSAGNINFSQNLYDAYVADNASTTYRMYFTTDDAGDNAGNDFDTSGAIVVNNNAGSPIEGDITAVQIAFDYDYSNNVQRGTGSDGVDAPITIVAIAHDGAQWIEATGTITEATGLTFNVNANDELNYSNPA